MWDSCKFFVVYSDKRYVMVNDLSKIHGSFQITSLNPVTRAGDGNFMEVLRGQFDEVTAKLTPVQGMPGVYAPNPAPEQTLASLNIETKAV